MVTSYIGIGSNLGDRQGNINKAISYLKDSDKIEVKKVSSIYETEPIGGPPQGKFLNGVIEIDTDLSPLDLLDRLDEIEMKLGRVHSEKNGPRTIDLDILLYSDTQINNERLTIPHPHMQEREFVLRGLREITQAGTP
ncbi:MAG: 2-amino-4-hydroxy-6-hydroxymethyldihydropteridine diphosphokinase [Candidatus Omnitrophica bacterium]|nr:2-amino-4-hydroxy-6-hydroxymethyldihydropteridine diphosphokinase [Candidatus Omnitrophota bacterium]